MTTAAKLLQMADDLDSLDGFGKHVRILELAADELRDYATLLGAEGGATVVWMTEAPFTRYASLLDLSLPHGTKLFAAAPKQPG